MTTDLTITELLDQVVSPPDALRPTPLFWWSGDDVDPAKLRWQLDRLAAAGVGGTVVGYSHTPDNEVDAGSPTPLTPRWWEVFAQFVRDSRERGLTVGIQEYVVLNHVLLDHPQDPPTTAATLVEQSHRVPGGERLRVRAEHPILCAYAFACADRHGPDPLLDLRSAIAIEPTGDGRDVEWTAPPGDWQVCVVSTAPPVLHGAPLGFDPLRAGAAEHVIENFYAPFHHHLGDLLGTTMTTFFQDELDLGIRMPMWSGTIPAAFAERKGYSLGPEIVALWHDLGPVTAKIRVDYADVIVTLLQQHYFEPVFRWHRAHRTRLAMDQLSRGDLASGRQHYADYARTMRWFDAPGNDDPRLQDPRNRFGFKVNSSIAHLYERPTVWNEAFYGSGWGVTPAQILAGLNEDFAYGVTHVSLHGLYHSTRAGWWEWASPDFHFRQPYWAHLDHLWPYLTRAAFVLSQGSHRCDVAVLDPVTDLEATGDDPTAADAARTIVDGLVGRGRDADLVDFESLERAEIDTEVDAEIEAETNAGIGAGGPTLAIAGERYRVLVLPSCTVVRESTIATAERFVAAGGVVLAWGRPPQGSELAGSPTTQVIDCFAALGRALSGRGVGWLVPPTIESLVHVLDDVLVPDFSSTDGLLALHRALPDADLYWVTNPTDVEVRGDVAVRATGHVSELDLFTGGHLAVPGTRGDGPVTRIPLIIAPGAARCLVVARADLRPGPARPEPGPVITEVELDGPWASAVVPSLENAFGDFAHPAGELGVRTSTVRVREPVDGESTWVPRRIGDGPRLLVLGPIDPDADLGTVVDRLARTDQIVEGAAETIGGRAYRWRAYRFSESTGILDDPLLRHWNTGPHGLKGGVPDEFLDLSPLDPDAAEDGAHYLVWSTVTAAPGRHRVTVGSRSAHTVWVGGERVIVGPGREAAYLPPWGIQDYRIEPATVEVDLAGRTPVLARFTQGAAQRVRGYVVVDPPTGERTRSPHLRWWVGPDRALGFDPAPIAESPGWTAIRVDTPPGTTALEIGSRGPLRAADDTAITVTSEPDGDGWRSRVQLGEAAAARPDVELLVADIPGATGAAALTRPVGLITGPGLLDLGWWADHGLGEFSGRVRYRTTITLSGVGAGRTLLDLGRVAVSARVEVNDVEVGTAFAPPYVFDVGDRLHAGENTIMVEVANTLAEFYSVFPTPYADTDQLGGGLVGPVRLRTVGEAGD